MTSVAPILVAVLGGFAIYTFGWRDSNTDTGNDAVRAVAYAEEVAWSMCAADQQEGCFATSVERITGELWSAKVVRSAGRESLCVHIDLADFVPSVPRATRGVALVSCEAR